MIPDMIKRAIVENRERQFLQDFADQVASFMAPFHPGNICLEVRESLYTQDALHVTIPAMGGVFIFPIDYMEDGANRWESILNQLSEIFREGRVEPEEHIILGLE